MAGGSGQRMGATLPKQFITIGDKPILRHTIEAFLNVEEIQKIIVVLPRKQQEYWFEISKDINWDIEVVVVEGGTTRFESVKNGLNVLRNKDGLVAIHDGVRPFVPKEIIENSFKTAAKYGCAVSAVKMKDSLRKLKGNSSTQVDRTMYVAVQTPQTFIIREILEAYDNVKSEVFTDDASVWEHTGKNVCLINGDYRNIKITTPEDLDIALAFIQSSYR